ncbi:MAG TPA: magnesium/cobalt transporter CorA [Thermoanaerobaculia bacterium]|nr:magnesium/cobalt transporter CorA [Thermoanaerobaculia bacterium]
MIRLLTAGKRGLEETHASKLKSVVAAGTFAWVDITGPDDEEAALMRDLFHFHPLAIEDTRNQHQRPKVEEYPEHLFLILNPGELVDCEVRFRELDVFVASHLLVTVHPNEEPAVAEAERRASRLFPDSPSAAHVLYALLDTVVDGYFPMLDQLGDEIDQLEDLVLEKPSHETLERLFRLKRQLVVLRKVVAPQRDAMTLINRRDLPYLETEHLSYYLRDVQDHLLRITDMADTFRDLLSSGIDLYMSATSNRLNRVVNRLTVVTIVVGVLAVITGFYGMNFSHTWPPLGAPWGVPFAIGTMAAAVAIAVGVVRRLSKV